MAVKANQKKRLLALASEMAGEDSDSDGGLTEAAKRNTRQNSDACSSSRGPREEPQDSQHESCQLADGGKEKAFAWMDSEDELDTGTARPSTDWNQKKLDRRSGNVRKSRSRSRTPARKEITVSGIKTFGDFVRNSEDLVVMVPSIKSSDLVELLEAAARCVFFDGDLITALCKQFRTRLPKGDFKHEQVGDILNGLLCLNAYDAGVFHAAAQFLLPQITIISRTLRLNLVYMYEKAEHKDDKIFVTKLKTLPGIEKQDRDVDDEGKSACLYYIWGCCWAGKKCVYSHEAGLTLRNENKNVMINGNGAKQRDSYIAKGGPRAPLC